MSAYLRVCCDICGRDLFATSTEDLYEHTMNGHKVQHIEFYYMNDNRTGKKDYICQKCYERVVKEDKE